jgi:hypothetical protein
MKKITYTLLLIIGVFIGISCEQNKEINTFDTNNSYLYFDLPRLTTNFDRLGSKRVDSLIYSFALNLEDVTTYQFKIPIATSGVAFDYDREFLVEVVEEESTASEADWNITSIANPIFHKDRMFDTLLVTVNRSSILKTTWKTLVFRIKENKNFMLGRKDLLKAKISFTDILQPPVWWKDWKSIFGPFYLKTYLKWQEIYHKGADSNKAPSYVNVSKDSKDLLYWDNMPVGNHAGNILDTPSIFMFIAVLRDYFEANEVYGTNSDGSKTRIRIH